MSYYAPGGKRNDYRASDSAPSRFINGKVYVPLEPSGGTSSHPIPEVGDKFDQGNLKKLHFTMNHGTANAMEDL